jgi:hypothetical protein
MATNSILPTLHEVRRFLEFTGWSESASGPAGVMWTRNGNRLGVPHENAGDPYLISGIVERVAAAEGTDVRAASQRIRYLRVLSTVCHWVSPFRWKMRDQGPVRCCQHRAGPHTDSTASRARRTARPANETANETPRDGRDAAGRQGPENVQPSVRAGGGGQVRRPGTGLAVLITQRSHVLILPPLPL